MRKNGLAFFAIVILAAAMVSLYLYCSNAQKEMTDQLKDANTTIQSLQEERRVLVSRLNELNGNGETEEGDSEYEETTLASLQTILCLNAMDNDAYEEIIPVLRDAGITGMLMLRNGRLPGDNYNISVSDFVELYDSGWTYAISLEREPDDTAEDWQEDVEDYLSRLGQRVGRSRTPIAYCFPEGGCTEEEATFLDEHDFGFVLLHEQPGESSEGLKFVQLFPYNSQNLLDTLASTNGYFALEMWATWNDDTAESLRYQKDRLNALLSSDSIHLVTQDEMEPLSEISQEREETETEETDVSDESAQLKARIAEIDQQIDALYQGNSSQ